MWPMWVGDTVANGIGGDPYNLERIVDRIAPEKISSTPAEIKAACPSLGYPS